MSALLLQVQDLLSEQHSAFSYGMASTCRCGGCMVYIIAIEDQVFEGDTFSGVVDKAWAYVCEKESANG